MLPRLHVIQQWTSSPYQGGSPYNLWNTPTYLAIYNFLLHVWDKQQMTLDQWQFSHYQINVI